MNRHRSLAPILFAFLLSGCDLFDRNTPKDLTGPTPTTSRIKFFNFSPGSVGVNFFANDVKMSAISSAACTPLPAADPARANCLAAGVESTTGVVYGTCTNAVCNGGSASGGLYVAVGAGANTLIARIASRDTIVSTVTQTIENGKYYSFFMSGIYNTTAKTAEAFVIEDPIPTGTIDYSVAYVRLVNAISNGTTDLNLYATNTTTPITALGGAVAYRAGNAYVTIPAGTYDLSVRYTGSGTNLIARTGVSFGAGRVYTVTARGSTATAATLGLDNTENQR